MDLGQIDFGSIGLLGELCAAAASSPPRSSGAASSTDPLPPGGTAPAGASARAPAEGVGGPAPPVQVQVDLGEALVAREVHAKTDRRSKEHLARMRAAAGEARAKRVEKRAREELAQATGTLEAVRALLPGAAQLVAAPVAKHLSRKKDPQPNDFTLATRALHLPPASKLQLGIKLERLQCAGARLVLQRQEVGLRQIGDTLSAAVEGTGGAKVGHISFMHMWDEVEAKFAWRPAGHRARSSATMQQTLVQRGAFGFCLRKEGCVEAAYFAEHWLGTPLEVAGTSGAALLPGLRRFWPEAIRFDDLSALQRLVSTGVTFTFLPMCDKASGNLLLLKRWGHHWTTNVGIDPDIGNRVLFFPDVCSVHLHHRAKLQVRGLREHTVRHYSVANLMRLRGVQAEVLGRLEGLVSSRVVRVVGPPPEHGGVTLETIIDILFHMDDEHHNRKRGKSRRHNDLQRLGRLLNGNMLEDALTHHCWDAAEGRPCCVGRDECVTKVIFACSCALFGDGDPIPCESRWTSLLSNFKKTLLRRCTQRLGLDAFGPTLETEAEPVVRVDAAAEENYHQVVNRSRKVKTRAYFADERNISELVVYAAALDVVDCNLLFPFLGDALQEHSNAPSKLELILHPTQSKVAITFNMLHELLVCWADRGSRSNPWLLLDVVKAPLDDPKFLAWSRNQVLRLSSALFRRYEVRFAAWPYKLFALICPDFADSERQEVINSLFATKLECLDIYSRGIRALYPSAAQVMSQSCLATIEGDFRTHAHNIAQVERLNAEMTRKQSTRAPARSFAKTAHHSVLQQAKVVHTSRGGNDPLAPGTLGAQPSREKLSCNPLQLVGIADLPAAMVPQALGGSSTDSPASLAIAVVARGSAEVALAPRTMPGDLAFAQDDTMRLGAPVVIERENPATLGAPAQVTSEEPQQKRRGLNPYLLEKNKHMAVAKRALGRSMTEEERRKCTEDFQKLWAGVDKSIFKDAYTEWREATPNAVADDAMTPYTPSWGGGCKATPVTKFELHKYVTEHGWPKDSDLQQAGSSFRVVADNSLNEEEFAGFDIWGIGRSPHNIDRSGLDQAQFQMCEKGLFNVLERHFGKSMADSGGAMILVSGPSATTDRQQYRVACLVTGTCYSPKVWDATRLVFEDDSQASSLALTLPCWVKIGSRVSRLTKHLLALDTMTSDEFVLHLTERLSEMTVHAVEYEVVVREESLLWSKVTGLKVRPWPHTPLAESDSKASGCFGFEDSDPGLCKPG